MKCPKCGYSLPDDSEFCQYCGVNIDEEERAQAALAAAAGSAKETRDADYMGIVKDAAPVEREPESLFIQAYNSYISTTPAGQQLFNALVGGDALKTAYLEECEKQAKLNEAGIRVDYKDSYLEFMSILNKKYSNVTKDIPTVEPVSRGAYKQEDSFCVVQQTIETGSRNSNQVETASRNLRTKRKNLFRVLSIILSIAFVATLACCAWLYGQLSASEAAVATLTMDLETATTDLTTVKASIAGLQSLVTATKADLKKAEEEIDFLEDDVLLYIGYLSNADDKQYHYYSCKKITDYSSAFFAPIDYWETVEGYIPCSCWTLANWSARVSSAASAAQGGK